MEFFEKAHVVCINDTSGGSKSKENVKKQLKQMLHGYKQSDINLIKTSTVDQTDYYDDSTSVSGYSDLNLTNSSDEEHSACKKIEELDEDSYISDNSDQNTGNALTSNDAHQSNLNAVKDSITNEFNLKSEHTSLRDSDASIETVKLDSVSESNNSEPFDADGLLAAKILKRLQLNNIQNQTLKRKHEVESNENGIIEEDNKIKAFKRQEKQPTIPEEDEEISRDNSFVCDCAFGRDTYTFSPPYVSVTAVDIPLQSFNDILGDYKHRTVKNIPAKYEIVTEPEYYNFIVEDSESVDIQSEVEVGSLTPEPSLSNEIGEIEEIINLDSTTDTLETEIPIVIDLPFNDTVQSEPLSDKESTTDDDYYRVIETFKIYYGHECCIIIMKHPTELFIQGKVSIRILDGSVDIFGYTPKNDTHNVYAPFYSFAQSIKTIEKPNDYYGLFRKLTEAGLSVAEAEDIVITIGEHDGVVLLKPLVNKCMDFVENNFKITNLFVRSFKNVEPFFTRATNILNCSLFSIPPARCFRVHPVWKQADTYAQDTRSHGIICGGKGSGKSTYLRYQVNKLIPQGPVLLLDLDPGQSEFTVAGSLSATTVTEPLLGPSFTHLKKPDIMLNIGMINTMDNARRYVAALHQLITHCRNNDSYKEMPWIVNTMGMTNFLGLKIITLIIILAQPTYLIQYESKNAKRRFETFLRPNNVKLLYEEYKNDPLFRDITCPEDLDYMFIVANEADNLLKHGYVLTSKDERFLNFLAYFGQLITINKESLLAIIPYQVNLQNITIATNVIVKEEYITQVINGQVVALCQLSRQCDSRLFTLADKPLPCHGHGIVRGIDWEKGVIYVITPLDGNLLASVDTLLYADWSPDSVGQETRLPSGASIPYRTFVRYKHRQLMSTPRRRFNPLQLIKMTRSA